MDLANSVFIDISWRCIKNLNCLIGINNSDNLVIFKFRNSIVDLKYNFVNNFKKLECSQISKFIRFKTIRSWSFQKIIFVQKSGQNLTPLMHFANDDLLIILNRRNLETCEHSSFLIVYKIVFQIKLEVPKFKNY